MPCKITEAPFPKAATDDGVSVIHFPRGAEILGVRLEIIPPSEIEMSMYQAKKIPPPMNLRPQLMVLLDPEAPTEARRFKLLRRGEDLPAGGKIVTTTTNTPDGQALYVCEIDAAALLLT
jgi:hypothetical protein